MSARTSISKPLDASGGMRPKGWRKPVPKLIPDPPKRHNSVSRSSSFRHLVLLPTNEPQPPMPDNWKENIDKALGKGSRVERIRSPMPPHHSRTDVSILESGASRADVSTSTRRHRRRGEEKALPMVGSFRCQIRMPRTVCLTQVPLSPSRLRLPRSSLPSNLPLMPRQDRQATLMTSHPFHRKCAPLSLSSKNVARRCLMTVNFTMHNIV
ncbi:hypothetical protein BC629DRAFT_724272 [Irpex lacteus]|nr:hypothetical protein BC629DRAFT_724272 [Irpex lacteus]